jgi:DNA-binding transcriptional LysR family regulator
VGALPTTGDITSAPRSGIDMDHLRSMRAFVRIVDEGSLANAARAMDVAPAAMTRSLAELELHLGARLLNRTTRRMALTEIGEQYLERARAILADIEAAESLVSSAQSDPRGTVRVRAPAAFAIHQLAKHLPRFHAAYPHVTVEVCTLSAVEDVDEGHDLTILWRHRPLDGDFVARKLASSEVVMCAAPEYLNRRGRPNHPGELREHAILLPPATPGRPTELRFRRAPTGVGREDADVVVVRD